MAVIGDEDLHDADAALQRFVGTPRMTAPARFLADSLPLSLQCTVDNIEKTATGWHIEPGTGPTGRVVRYRDPCRPGPQAVPLAHPVAPAWRPLRGGQRCAAAGP
jgi:predicted NAD/FAD-dependent oxidoreductase